jgi:hypothetical protein
VHTINHKRMKSASTPGNRQSGTKTVFLARAWAPRDQAVKGGRPSPMAARYHNERTPEAGVAPKLAC